MAQKRIRSLKKSRAASVLEDAKQIIYKYGKQESLEKHIIKESQVKYCEGEETYSDEKKVFITVDLVVSVNIAFLHVMIIRYFCFFSVWK